ncbi:MAG: GIY-YIG nuclease family protein [Thermoplasmatales archaeon]|nr:GIY-YIG nuclease family protein [Thermoplasmatales archaeon]
MKGTYILIIEIDKDKKIRVGKRGIYFKKGYYAYVGSAMNSIEKRLERHLRKDKKKRWHIDYLIEKGKIKKIFYKESKIKEECDIAKKLGVFEIIPKFGSSDCKCKSHLFYNRKAENFYEILGEFRLFNF